MQYYAFESYQGVLRRAEAWRIHHHKSKADGNNLAYTTDPINFAKQASIDYHYTSLRNNNFRPDFVIIDTWFKATPGVNVGDQAAMTDALSNL